MADINLKEYLKNVAELESSIYNQKEVIAQSKDTFARSKPGKRSVVKRTLPYPAKPILENVQYTSKKENNFGCLSVVVPFILAVVFAIVCYVESENGNDAAVIPLAILSIVCVIVCIVMFKVDVSGKTPIDKASRQEAYEKAMAEYQAQCEQINQKNAALEKDFANKQRKANAEFDKKWKIYEKNSREITTELNSNLSETERILKSYYDKDIIFEKYRNLVAMTTMYEYFASGRCTELEGPNGAYNLYEQETRQNVIITNLQDINQHLGDIKNNQYVLYQAMNQGLETMNRISTDISAMANSVKSIEQASQITAYFAEISAKNETFQSLSIII